MRAINHALTGSLIGLTVTMPAIALPLAVASHFICDMIPHYSSDQPDKKYLKSQVFRRLLYADALLCLSLVLFLAARHPLHWWLAAACAFLATSPDFFWLGKYICTRSGKKWRPTWFSRFAGNIQWFQRPIGAAVEVAWFTSALIILAPFFR